MSHLDYRELITVGALIGPSSEASWRSLLSSFGLALVLITIRALRADADQPVNAADVRATLTRAVLRRDYFDAESIDIPHAVTPARSPVPMCMPRSLAAPASTQSSSLAGTMANGSRMAAEQIPDRLITAIHQRKIGRYVAAAEMGMSAYTLIRILEGVNTQGVHFTTLNKILVWLAKQPTTLANVIA